MDATAEYQPDFVLIDDDPHSARFLMRKLEAAARQSISWEYHEDAEAGRNALSARRAAGDHADLVIVDLKAHSQANEEFISAIVPAGSPVVTMIAGADDARRGALRRAGVAEVFDRPADIDAYTAEVSKLLAVAARFDRAG